MELSGPGVQYIAGAPSNVRLESGDKSPKRCCQFSLNLLTYPKTKELGEWSMSINPYLSEARHRGEKGEVNAFYALVSLTTVELCTLVGNSLVIALYRMLDIRSASISKDSQTVTTSERGRVVYNAKE